MSLINDYGFFQFTVTSDKSDDSIVSNKAALGDGNAVNIRVSMFFDGTNNNKFNTEGRLEFFKSVHGQNHDAEKAGIYEKRVRSGKSGLKKDDSYASDYSNVARLFKNYEKKPLNKKEATDCIYVEGIGTTSDGEDIIGGDDDKFGGGAFGAGKTGIPKKVKKGCDDLAKLCKKIANGDPISSLMVDVFGFSRGAAAARHFIYEISKEKQEATSQILIGSYGTAQSISIPEQPAFGALGKAFKNNEFEFEGEIKIAFAGLFDTVPAYMAKSDGGTEALHLDAVGRAKDVLHLTAMDERRKNFALADITISKGSAYEKALPGVHCDIGGSYNPIVKEKDKIVFAGSYFDMQDEVEYLLEEGWYWSRKQLECNFGYLGTLKRGFINAQGYVKTVGTKEVKNQYSFIPLFIMKDKAQLNTNGVQFKAYIEVENEIPEELMPTNKRLRAYVFEKAEPMKFYTRKELDREIAALTMMHKPYNLSNETYVAEPVSTRVSQAPVLELHKTANAESDIEPTKKLNANDYPDHPVLQQKINDHLTLLGLRAKYFHTSHECSNLKAATGIAFFDPYAASIRTKPSRKINKG